MITSGSCMNGVCTRSLFVQVEIPRVSCRTGLWIIFRQWAILVYISLVPRFSTCLGKQTVRVVVTIRSPTSHWLADPITGYSVIDFSLVDPHFGTLQSWIDLVDAMHSRNMYLIADFTVGTMGDMIGVEQ